MASEQGMPVELYIYDLTNGLASVLSPAILDTSEHPLVIGKEVESEIQIGRQVEGVWHTAVVAYGREYFYGGGGITSCAPGGTQLGAPHQVERLGDTFVPFQVFVDYIQGLGTTAYTGAAYRLLEHNCNHFSDEVAQFLCGARVPKHILTQPDQLPAPLRLALAALLDDLVPQAAGAGGVRRARQDSPEYVTLNDQIEQARAQGVELGQRRSSLAEKVARKERRREKRRHKHGHPQPAPDDMAEAVEAPLEAAVGAGGAGPSAAVLELDERRQLEQQRRELDPPIVYSDIDGAVEFEALERALAGAALAAEERGSLEELRQYLVLGEGSWVLGDDFLAFIGRILSDESLAAARVPLLRSLAAAALREDVSLVLHADRRQHALLTYAHGIDRLPEAEQLALALFMCNLFEHISSSEWLLYISEWEAAGQPLSNIRATTKVCVHAALAQGAALRELGTALMYNVAAKEVKTVRFSAGRALRDLLPSGAKSKVFDEVSVELAMALLQLLQWAPSEEHLFRALKALARLAAHSADVPQLVAMLGPEPSAFRGTSARVDEQIDLIAKKLK